MLMSNGALTPSPSVYGDAQQAWTGQQFYYAGQGLSLTDAFVSYAAVYKTQPWIASLVNKIAGAAARLPLKVYERQADDSRIDGRDTPFGELLRNPNPRHDPFFFWLWTVSTFEIYGEAIWIKIRPRKGAAPTQLWPLHPANVLTYRNTAGELIYRYIYGSASGQFLEWDVGDVVHFKSYNPDDQVRGLSRLEPLRQTILNEDSARRAAAAMWSNGGRPSFALTSPKTLTQPAMDRLEANVKGLHQGVDNWGKIAILEEGLTPTTFALDAEAMQFIEGRKVSRDEACGVYDVPPPVVQILDRATFSNITEQMRSMYRDTMAPRLGLYESVVDAQLRPDFDPRGVLYAEFLLEEVLRGAFEQRAASNQAAIFSGQRTPNEVRKQDNLPPLEGGDKLYINAGAVPLEQDAAGGLVPNEDPAVPPKKKAVELEVLDSCGLCGDTSGKTSARGLCRGCEGKFGSTLTPKEITA